MKKNKKEKEKEKKNKGEPGAESRSFQKKDTVKALLTKQEGSRRHTYDENGSAEG